MRRIFTFFLTFLLGMFVTALYAQTHTVSGTVIDKDANEPLIGANVLIKGTTIGTVTDLDGKYTLQAGDKDILVFSYLSMKTIEEPVNGRTVINVKMTSDTETLGEVVVTAMGIKRQSDDEGTVQCKQKNECGRFYQRNFCGDSQLFFHFPASGGRHQTPCLPCLSLFQRGNHPDCQLCERTAFKG